MKIVIDCFKLIKGAGKSIGIYNLTVSLVRNLVNYQQRTEEQGIKNAEIIVVGNQYNRLDFEQPGITFTEVEKYDPRNKLHCILWELFAVSSFCKKLDADRVIFPRGFCALTHPVKDIVIIHDMIPFYYHEHYPGYFRKLENAYIMNRLKNSALKCGRVITISEASKNEIIRYCGKEPGDITVIYNGCNPVSFDGGSKSGNESPYICAMTSGLPHKNAKGIFRAYKKYCEISDQPIDLKVIGVSDTAGIEFDERIKKKITCFKYIREDEELHKLIAGAEVFLFLSYVEGFGFPPIEAMQLGVPVICSDRSSLREVVGNAAVLADPDDAEGIAAKLEELIGTEDLRNEKILLARENVKRFYWDRVIQKYWETIMKE